MNEDIKVGDLVICIKPAPCCGYDKNVGKIFTVSGIPDVVGVICPKCRDVSSPDGMMKLSAGFYVHKRRLKKIPPLTYEEFIETKNDLDLLMKDVV